MAPRKECGPVRAWAEYLPLLGVAKAMQALPLSWAAGCGRGLGWLWHLLDSRHSRACRERSGEMLGLDAPAADALARGMYRHLGTMIAEFCRQGFINRDNLASAFDFNGMDEAAFSLLKSGKGIIFATGHIGNWEACGYCSKLRGFVEGAVARPLDNPLLNQWVNRQRGQGGQQIWEKRGALRSALRTLKDGQAFGILVDQDGGKDGVFAPFMGKLASTMPAPAILAMRTGAPILVAACHRVSPMRFRMSWREPFYADPSAADERAETVRLLTRMNGDLSSIISERPEQWLWLHRRWKTRPEDVGR